LQGRTAFANSDGARVETQYPKLKSILNMVLYFALQERLTSVAQSRRETWQDVFWPHPDNFGVVGGHKIQILQHISLLGPTQWPGGQIQPEIWKTNNESLASLDIA
jgi:hypothetical protein